MQAAIKFANACEFDHRKAFHIPHFDFFEESASASPMLFNGSASADKGQVSDKSNSAASLTQGLSAPLKLSKTRRLAPKTPSRRLTLRAIAAASTNTWKILKRAWKKRLSDAMQGVGLYLRTFIRWAWIGRRSGHCWREPFGC